MRTMSLLPSVHLIFFTSRIPSTLPYGVYKPQHIFQPISISTKMGSPLWACFLACLCLPLSHVHAQAPAASPSILPVTATPSPKVPPSSSPAVLTPQIPPPQPPQTPPISSPSQPPALPSPQVSPAPAQAPPAPVPALAPTPAPAIASPTPAQAPAIVSPTPAPVLVPSPAPAPFLTSRYRVEELHFSRKDSDLEHGWGLQWLLQFCLPSRARILRILFDERWS